MTKPDPYLSADTKLMNILVIYFKTSAYLHHAEELKKKKK